MGVDRGAPGKDLSPLDVEPERPARGIEDIPPSGDDLGPDTVPGNSRQAVLRHEGSSTTRGETNATETPLISAPRSLFTATR